MDLSGGGRYLVWCLPADYFRSTNIVRGATCLDERLPLDLIV